MDNRCVTDVVEMIVRSPMSQVQMLRRIDRAVHRRIRIFEQGNNFYLHEQSGRDHDEVAPRKQSPLATPIVTKNAKRKAHLTAAPPGPSRNWSGATGFAAPSPRSAWRAAAPPPALIAPPQRALQAKPKRHVREAPQVLQLDDISANVSASAQPSRAARPTLPASAQVAHTRQVAHMLRSIANVIQPRQISTPAGLTIAEVEEE